MTRVVLSLHRENCPRLLTTVSDMSRQRDDGPAFLVTLLRSRNHRAGSDDEVAIALRYCVVDEASPSVEPLDASRRSARTLCVKTSRAGAYAKERAQDCARQAGRSGGGRPICAVSAVPVRCGGKSAARRRLRASSALRSARSGAFRSASRVTGYPAAFVRPQSLAPRDMAGWPVNR